MSLLSRTTRGAYAIAPTPFLPDGSLDLDSLRRLVDFYGEVGVDGLTLLGQMGEASKLTQAEAVQIIATVIDRTHLPVVVGVSAPGFGTMKELTHEAMSLGAKGVLVGPPNTLRTDDQIVDYYTQVAQALGPDVPIVLQDYPLTFSVVISVPVLQRIARDVPSVVMLKHEDWPGLEKISAIRAIEAAGEMPRLSILCGNGGLFLDFEIQRGADGAMTGYCFPELLVDLVRLGAEGSTDEAHDLFDAHLPLIRYEQQVGTGLAVRKYIMRRRGLLHSDAQRLPGRSLSAAERGEVDLLLRRLGKRDARSPIGAG
ncbi:dihydrodipicolinate synthase family protein [Frankia sp. CNm7]|uniref:Dihydrodipicolinate synthase family protein n=1 Tax=Frankia nepalensis TaxID=1836974 RepID=A0A937UWI0_9ACTN|nr:dihydrodipicolinate synthase family protein [Frankia nepalensis]MBL7501983.1 dihydrodipicolinate synthase family protein [Frankia nepalensis]MBL7510613.1 dihydrodipicolinate synthase family protein [Frankia nepalensis]MBL7517353.1 dihydrodipicolinate synthase family protein [Frankia nepalensis]MBL7633436.1 dihydrodipicolinate synthase family protein [Frankia nepalensis]